MFSKLQMLEMFDFRHTLPTVAITIAVKKTFAQPCHLIRFGYLQGVDPYEPDPSIDKLAWFWVLTLFIQMCMLGATFYIRLNFFGASNVSSC